MYSRIVWFVWFLERNERRKKQQSSIWDWDMRKTKWNIRASANCFFSKFEKLPYAILANFFSLARFAPSSFLFFLSSALREIFCCFVSCTPNPFLLVKSASLVTNKPSKAFFPLLVLFVCTFRRCSCRLCSALQFPKLTFFLWKKAAQFSVLSCWLLQCKYVNKNSHTLSVLKSPDEFPFSPPLWSQSPLLFQCLVECPN